MKIPVPKILRLLAEKFEKPLYVVGGYTRNYIAEKYISEDIDIAGDIVLSEFIEKARALDFSVVAEYKRTGTVKIVHGKNAFEYTRFRTDNYLKGGKHAPDSVEFTGDITLDALRRDFKCNAVYYDIKNDSIVDPLFGVKDIKNRLLDTVRSAEEVFKSDGLRLLRLARFAAELGFSPTENALKGAKQYASNVSDIVPERIYDEIKKTLCADKKYPFSPENGHYVGFRIMQKTDLLDIIFPERAAINSQNGGEKALKILLYAERDIRLSALLFGLKDNTADILRRLKVDKKTAKETAFLVNSCSFDSDNDKSEIEIRRFIVENKPYIKKFLALKQAVYCAERGERCDCPTVKKWRNIYQKMQREKVPFKVNELKITANDLAEIGFKADGIGRELKKLWSLCIDRPQLSVKELKEIAVADITEK